MHEATTLLRADAPAGTTRIVRAEQFVELLISRKKLERDLRTPLRLVCRESGVTYVREDAPGRSSTQRRQATGRALITD